MMKIYNYLLATGVAVGFTLTGCSYDEANINYPTYILALEECPAGYQMVSSDDFDSDGLPNENRWEYYKNMDGIIQFPDIEKTKITSAYVDYNSIGEKTARVKDGKLILTALHDPHEGIDMEGKPVQFEFSSAALATKDEFISERGRIDIMARIPNTQGIRPSFRMIPSTSKYAKYASQINIMEYKWNLSEIHKGFRSSILTQDGINNRVEIPSIVTENKSIDNKFHLYSLVWGYKKVQVLFDNKVVLSYSRSNNMKKHWPFDQPHALLMSLDLDGDVDQKTLPCTMEIEYVRYFKLEEEESKPVFPVVNYINNGDFETPYAAGKEPAISKRTFTEKDKCFEWVDRWYANVIQEAILEVVKEGANSTAHSLKYSNTPLPNWYNTDMTFSFQGVKQGTYTLSFWAKTIRESIDFSLNVQVAQTEKEAKNGYNKQMSITFDEQGNSYLEKTPGMYCTLSDKTGSEWKKFSSTFYIPENILLMLQFKLHTSGNVGHVPGFKLTDKSNVDFWIDEIALSEAED